MMALARRSPFELFDQIWQRVEELFARHFDGAGQASWVPACEAYVAGDRFIVRFALPGVDPADIHLTVTGRMLTVSGQRKAPEQIPDENYWLRGLSYGQFERSVMLPEAVDTGAIRASYRHGILQVEVPLPKELASKAVPITVEQPALTATA